MKLRSLILVTVFLFGSIPSSVVRSTGLPNCSWQLTFDENFEGSALDQRKWNTRYPSGNSGEQQFYAPDAFLIKDGLLNITANRRRMSVYPYSSGIITTQGRFSQKYGFFTMRAKLPGGQGFWPAFWLLPVRPDFPTEVDVFELIGSAPHTLHLTVHWKKPGAGRQRSKLIFHGPDFSADFHTFSLLWEPDRLSWYIDGVQQFTVTQGIPTEPMFMLANLAVGGKWPGSPDQTTPFPSSMQLDYVYAYQKICLPTSAP